MLFPYLKAKALWIWWDCFCVSLFWQDKLHTLISACMDLRILGGFEWLPVVVFVCHRQQCHLFLTLSQESCPTPLATYWEVASKDRRWMETYQQKSQWLEKCHFVTCITDNTASFSMTPTKHNNYNDDSNKNKDKNNNNNDYKDKSTRTRHLFLLFPEVDRR